MTKVGEYQRKQDLPDYAENRAAKKREQSKLRYSQNPEIKEKMKARAKRQYQELKKALEIVKKLEIA